MAKQLSISTSEKSDWSGIKPTKINTLSDLTSPAKIGPPQESTLLAVNGVPAQGTFSPIPSPVTRVKTFELHVQESPYQNAENFAHAYPPEQIQQIQMNVKPPLPAGRRNFVGDTNIVVTQVPTGQANFQGVQTSFGNSGATRPPVFQSGAGNQAPVSLNYAVPGFQNTGTGQRWQAQPTTGVQTTGVGQAYPAQQVNLPWNQPSRDAARIGVPIGQESPKFRAASPQPAGFSNMANQAVAMPGSPGLIARNRSVGRNLGPGLQTQAVHQPASNPLSGHLYYPAQQQRIQVQTNPQLAPLREAVFRKYAPNGHLAAPPGISALSELAALQGKPTPNVQLSLNLLATSDSNQDGFVTFEEFHNLCNQLAL